MLILIPTFGRLGREGNLFILMLVAIGLFIACTVASCNEIRYTMFGKTGVADVEKVYKRFHANDSDKEAIGYRVEYVLNDPAMPAPNASALGPAAARLAGNGSQRHETDTVSDGWFEAHRDALFDAEGKTVAVQYLAGSEGNSRLLGNTSRWVLIPFVIVVGFLALVSARFWIDFSAHQKRLASEDRR